MPPDTSAPTAPAELPLDAYPLHSFDKLRYGDTDRQGHVNNAVFTTFMETGRVELLLDPAAPMTDPGCEYVIARLELDYRGEVTWPGTVDIGTRVLTLGRSSMTLDQGAFQAGHCIARARTVIVQLDTATRRSQAMSQAIRDRLATFMVAE